MEYSSSHKYVFPRHHRERHCYSNALVLDCPFSSPSSLNKFPSLHRNYSSVCENSNISVNSVSSTAAGSAVSLAASEDPVRLALIATGERPLKAADVSAGGFTIIVRYKVETDANQNLVEHGSLGGAGDGYYFGFYAAGDWLRCVTYNSAGSDTGWSNPYAVGSWFTVAVVNDTDNDDCYWWKDSVDFTNATYKEARLPDPATSAGPRIGTASYAQTIARVMVFDRMLSHEEVAMITADLA